MTDNKNMLSISTKKEIDGATTARALEFYVGDTRLDGVMSAQIEEILPDSMVVANVKVLVRLGR
jgi:hypothetical protein